MNLKKLAATALMGAFAFGTVVTPASAQEPTVTPQEPQKSVLETQTASTESEREINKENTPSETPPSTEETETPTTTSQKVSFDLHAHVFDYGEAIDQVQIDLTSVLGDQTIASDALSADMFQVSATAIDPYNSHAVLYEDVARTVTGVSVENGIVTLDLACQYNGQGQSTLNYSMEAGRNLSAGIAYDITLTKDISLSDGTVLDKDVLVFNQNEIVNEETAAFTPGQSDGLNYQLYIPENSGDGEKHPLIIWFHGGG